MSATEFVEWTIYKGKLEPWYEPAVDRGFALMVSTLANIHRDAKKRRKPYALQDFLPDFLKPPPDPKRVQNEMLAWMQQMKAAQEERTKAQAQAEARAALAVAKHASVKSRLHTFLEPARKPMA